MSNAADYKKDGLWAKTVYLGNGKIIMTQAYQTYNAMVDRTKAGGKLQAKRPTYIGCTNNFESFQHFTDWAVQQVGYGMPGFELDKDLLYPGNKTYSPETCCFLPRQINTSLQRDKLSKKSGLPAGVFRHNKTGLKAEIRIDGKKVFLASTAADTEENREHLSQIYQRAKSDYLHDLANRYQHALDPRAYQSLLAL